MRHFDPRLAKASCLTIPRERSFFLDHYLDTFMKSPRLLCASQVNGPFGIFGFQPDGFLVAELSPSFGLDPVPIPVRFSPLSCGEVAEWLKAPVC